MEELPDPAPKATLTYDAIELSTAKNVDEKAVETPRALSGRQQSFLQIADERVLAQAWKPAEDGRGTILRLLDLGGTTRPLSLRFPKFALGKASETDAVERDRKELSITGQHDVTVEIHPHEILTLRLIPANPAEAATFIP